MSKLLTQMLFRTMWHGGLLVLVLACPAGSATAAPLITNTAVSSGNIILSGSAGASGGTYRILATTNVSVPVANWPAIAINNFDADGNFAFSSAINPGNAGRFYLLQTIPTPVPDPGLVGWATINGNVTGGQGGQTVTVSDAAGFTDAITAEGPSIVRVAGTIDAGSVFPASNKTIVGAGTNAAVIGDITISGVSNIIVQNLLISNDAGVGAGDGISVSNFSHHLWIDHCTFVDCADGELDMTLGSDYTTISWCKFYYTRNNNHNFCNLISANVNNTQDAGRMNITFHHNWWTTGCKERMPRVRFGKVHVFNNYLDCAGDDRCVWASYQSQLLVENNYYQNVKTPYEYHTETNSSGDYGHGLMKTVGNITINCTNVLNFTNTVFAPPYEYALETPAAARTNVMANAGAGNAALFP